MSTVLDLIVSFRNFHRRVNPVSSSLGTFGVTLEAACPANGNHGHTNSDKSPPICVCGIPHWFDKCETILSILAPETLPSTFKPDPVKEEKVKEALNDPEKKKIEKANSKKIKSGKGKQNKQTDSWPNIRTNADPNTTSTPFDTDNDQTVSATSHTHALHAVMSAKVNEESPMSHLMNRWILDPGSNTHV